MEPMGKSVVNSFGAISNGLKVAQSRMQRPSKPPKGFDITLAGVVTLFNLDMEEIQKLGELTAKREIANAVVGHQVWYRRATIERVFNKKPVGDTGGKQA